MALRIWDFCNGMGREPAGGLMMGSEVIRAAEAFGGDQEDLAKVRELERIYQAKKPEHKEETEDG